MRLIQPINSVERALMSSALVALPGDGEVYAGEFDLGEAMDELLAAHQAGTLAGVVGLQISEEMVTRYSPEIRAHVGALLQLGGVPSVADDLGMEWCLHLGFQAKRGAHLAWAASEIDARRILDGKYIGPFEEPGTIPEAGDVGTAIACAILDIPCALLSYEPWGSNIRREHALLLRWARDAGVEANVCWSLEEVDAKIKSGDVLRVSRDLFQARREQALAMLAELTSQQSSDPLTVALGLPESAPPPPRVGRGRILELGSTFDPSTHYGEEYFGGAEGIHYCLPSGQWDLYHGTAHAWGGFKHVAAWLKDSVKGERKPDGAEHRYLLDIGCGSGAFVEAAVAEGFDAYGMDISREAVAMAPEWLAPRLQVADITSAEMGVPKDDIITAFDLWEHLPLSKVDHVMEVVRYRLRKGGLGIWNICTRGAGEDDWTLEPPCEVTKDNSWLLVSGHLTIRAWGWWREQFERHGMIVRRDLCHSFQVMQAEDPAMKGNSSWSARNFLVTERVK